jgi:hypothetical protein
MKQSPASAGGFFWVFADESVARTDQDGHLDSDGNHAPDGIVGPHHEKEGSFYTVKEIWSPVQVSLPAVLPANWDGKVAIANEYRFTDLGSVSFRWEWVQAGSTGEKVVASTDDPALVLAPGATGTIQSPRSAPAGADFLRLTAFNGQQALWTSTAWVASHAASSAATGAPVAAPAWLGEPAVVVLRRQDRHYEPAAVSAAPSFKWTQQADGALRLDYEFTYDGPADVLGIRFPMAEALMQAKRWLGRGPYRVWQNRLEGVWLGVHSVAFNDSTPGDAPAYPEFKGCFRDWRWLELATPEGRLTVENLSDVPYFGLGKPRDGVNGLLDLPDFGLSFLEVIPAMRNKFHTTEQLGPQSRTREVSGLHRGSLLFRFDSR